MSTTFAIFDKEIGRSRNGQALYDEDEAEYFVIGKTFSFSPDGAIIQKHLKDDTPVYALDNDSKVKTIKDLREYYKE